MLSISVASSLSASERADVNWLLLLFSFSNVFKKQRCASHGSVDPSVTFFPFFRYYDFSNVTRLHYLFRAALVLIWILPLVSYIFLIVPAPAVCSSAFCNVSNTCLSECERTPTDESLTITNYFRRGVHFAPFSPQRRARLLPCCFFFFLQCRLF